MTEIDFLSFLVLLVISIVVALLMQYVARIEPIKGIRGLINNICVGFIGAWLGHPIIGHWFKPIRIWDVYIIPALLGSALLIYIFSTIMEFVLKALTEIKTTSPEVKEASAEGES